MGAVVVLLRDGVDEGAPARRRVERGAEALHDRAARIGGHAVGDAAA
jgi:hypothetical protein